MISPDTGSFDTGTIPEGRRALARLAGAASGGLITTTNAAQVLGVTPRAAATRLARLARSGWLVRARRGLYLIPAIEAQPGVPTTAEDPWVLADHLFSPCYIAGWTAAEHWGLTEQIFRSTFVATASSARRRHASVLGAEFQIVRVPPRRITGVERVWRNASQVAVSDRERTIADALVDPAWVGGVRHLVEMLVTYRNGSDFNPRKLLARTRELGKGAAFKRLGYFAETALGGEPTLVAACQAAKSTGAIKLDPGVASRGHLLRRWGLWVNVDITQGRDAA